MKYIYTEYMILYTIIYSHINYKRTGNGCQNFFLVLDVFDLFQANHQGDLKNFECVVVFGFFTATQDYPTKRTRTCQWDKKRRSCKRRKKKRKWDMQTLIITIFQLSFALILLITYCRVRASDADFKLYSNEMINLIQKSHFTFHWYVNCDVFDLCTNCWTQELLEHSIRARPAHHSKMLMSHHSLHSTI